MRRTLVALLLLCGSVAVPAFAQDAGPADRPPLKASLAACANGAGEDQRFAVFTASMPAYRGTKRMAMRFDLFVRTGGSKLWRPVKSKGFGRWERSDPGRAGFVWTKRVERLLQGAEYRSAVRFRWYQADAPRPDRVRRSPVCTQPDQRPNLLIDALAAGPAVEGRSTYRVTVRNDGRTAAGAFDVTLTSSAPDEARTIASLPAGERATVELTGGLCTDDVPVRVILDPDRVVDESDETDNRSSGACEPR
jgi:hypothetical protein